MANEDRPIKVHFDEAMRETCEFIVTRYMRDLETGRLGKTSPSEIELVRKVRKELMEAGT